MLSTHQKSHARKRALSTYSLRMHCWLCLTRSWNFWLQSTLSRLKQFRQSETCAEPDTLRPGPEHKIFKPEHTIIKNSLLLYISNINFIFSYVKWTHIHSLTLKCIFFFHLKNNQDFLLKIGLTVTGHETIKFLRAPTSYP